MRLGRGSGRRVLQSASNTGLALRAENRLVATAEAYAARVETALAVDGTTFIIWNKGQGRYKCACTNGIFANQPAVTTTEREGSKPIATSFNGRKKKFRPVDELIDPGTSGGNDTFETSPRDRILKQDTDDLRKFGIDYARNKLSSIVSPSEDPLLSALQDFEESDKLLSEEIISCPLCFGSNYVDAWQVDKGVRILMDLSGRYETDMDNIDIVKTDVPKFRLRPGTSISWKVQLPLTWLLLARASLYDEEDLVPTNAYTLKMILPDATELPFTISNLRSLKGNMDAAGDVQFVLQSNTTDDLIASHFEIIYMLGRPTRGQMPEIEIPYEDEYADWNLNTNVELSPTANIKEGSYVVDGRYKRTWKVDSYSRKALTSGTVYGYTATLRALQPFEKTFSMMNLYKK